LICVEIFGYEDAATRQYATELGVALQLTNILRDVPTDLARGRVYIPQEDLRRHGCSERDLAAEVEHAGTGVRSPHVKSVLRAQAVRAHEYYRKAAASRPARDARRLVAAEIMGAIYRRILVRIERRDYDVFSALVRVPRPERALVALATWTRTAVGL
jgi:phytoene synthase